MRFAVLALAAACVTNAQQETPSGGAPLLGQIRARMAENLSRLPNYTCAQTTERVRRHGPGRQFQLVDTVRLEVALVEGKELFGWPGSNRIVESDLTRLIGDGGAISNGSFALLARSVFLSPSTSFQFHGTAKLNGSPALRFDYQVPAAASTYHLKVDSNDKVVGYHGSFWADRDSLDLLRLEISADNIPDELGLRSAWDAMDYARLKIGDSDFLLPIGAELNLTTDSGVEDRNRTRFHACRQYSGESVLSFADPAEFQPPPAAPQISEVELPADFQSDIILQTPVTSSSAIGDVVSAKLVHRIKNDHKTVFPRGAILTGRIVRLHRDDGWYHIGISFTDLESDHNHADLSERRNLLFVATPLRDLLPGSPRNAFHHTFKMHSAAGEGEITISTDAPLRLKAGYRMTLRSRLLQSGK